MKKSLKERVVFAIITVSITMCLTGAAGAELSDLSLCADLAFSTEEDFVTQGPEPPDGNPIVSDGDLLGPGCVICARNSDLMAPFDIEP